MDTNVASLPIFKWEKLLNYFSDVKLAEEILTTFQKQLIEDKQELLSGFGENNLQKLLCAVTRLIGSTVYCGTPRLHQVAQGALQHLKSNTLTPAVLDNVFMEIDVCSSTIIAFAQDRLKAI